MRFPTARGAAALLVLLVGCSSAEPDPGKAPPADMDASTSGDAPGSGMDGAAHETGTASTDGGDAGGDDTGSVGDDAGDGAASNACAPYGAPGECMTVSACSAMADHTPYAGYCPGPADIECCIVTPSTADNPPTPAGYVLMQQQDVTTAMTTWAVAILNDPTTYPMFSTTTMTFGTQLVLARVEWHPPDSNNETIHRGVTLYEPAG
jgi:hypothetical protein